MPTATQPFDSTWESLQTYRCPGWFRDAKFGVWAHWGPQAVPMVGDWYAGNLYDPEHPQGAHHRRVYGHPSQFGWKDIIPLWKAEKFDPDELMGLYQTSGAKYFTACGVHHDNYDCWDSTHHPWNAVKIGPGKDIVGLWKQAADAAGMRFGVTEHHARTLTWFGRFKGADASGPHAGVPYDTNDPRYADLYHPPHDEASIGYPHNPPQATVDDYVRRINDLVEKYDPDLLYTDGGVAFGAAGRGVIANLYNRNIERRGGNLEAVYAVKDPARHDGEYLGDYREGIGVLDMERGVIDGIHANPWQTDTCVGDWYYKSDSIYKKPGEIITMLADIVSKNGNLLLNLPLHPSGTLDEEARWILAQIGGWLTVNGEAIYGTRPWKKFGEGGTRLASGSFAEKEAKAFTPADFRFTTKGDALYAIALGWPTDDWVVTSVDAGRVKQVSLLGHDGPLEWSATPDGLKIAPPARRPCDHAWCLRIES